MVSVSKEGQGKPHHWVEKTKPSTGKATEKSDMIFLCTLYRHINNLPVLSFLSCIEIIISLIRNSTV